MWDKQLYTWLLFYAVVAGNRGGRYALNGVRSDFNAEDKRPPDEILDKWDQDKIPAETSAAKFS